MSDFINGYQPAQIPVDDSASATVLLVDDDPRVLAALRRLLRRERYRILSADNSKDALALLAEHDVGVLLLDQRLPGNSGPELLDQARRMHPHTTRIVLSGYTAVDSLTEAINRGELFKFLTKPWDDGELLQAVRDGFRHYAKARD